MRKIIVSNFVSLDGYFAGPNDDLSWHNVNDEFLQYAEDMLNSVDVILFGRITYQMMKAYWTMDSVKVSDPVIAGKMNNLPKIVLSKTLDKVDWGNSSLLKDDIEQKMRDLKSQSGKDIVILGSGSIVSAFTQMGIIDEYRIFINPVILGGGKLHFTGDIERKNLVLTDVKRFETGLVMLNYKPK